MDTKTRQLLEKAKACAYSWKLLEAYNTFRRFFDRLPFAPEKEHAEYIGLFVRVLFELGKEFELNFYLSELERLYEKTKEPYIAYPLGVVYSYSGTHKLEAAKLLFDEIVRNPDAKPYHAKSKMMLADYYQRKGDFLACRMLIESIDTAGDEHLSRLVEIWKALIMRCEKRYAEGRAILEKLLKSLTPEKDWYSHFSAKLQLAMIYVESGDMKRAQSVIAEVRALFGGRRFKMVQVQLSALEDLVREKTGLGKIKLVQRDDECLFTYADKTLPLTDKSPAEKLLMLLLKKGFLDKAVIVKNLYDRQYSAQQDDKLIYYHIHTLRKRLKAIGLPPEAIESEGNGYRLVPEVETLGGDS